MSDIILPIKKDNKKIKLKEVKKPSFWSKEEDKILMEKAQQFNYKNWNAIANFIPGRTSIQCSARYRRIRPGLIKGAWDKDEDSKLLKLYEKYGKNWAAISKEMPERTGKQIRDRFLNSLDSKFERGKFTEEEDQMILRYYKIYGNSWSKIAKKLKTRTGDMVKNRFYSSLKKFTIKNKNFLRRKRVNFSLHKNKNKISNDKIQEEQKDKSLSDIQKDSTNTENDSSKRKEEEKENLNTNDKMKETNDEIKNKSQEKNELNIIDNGINNYIKDLEEKSNNHIIIRNDSLDDSLDYSEKMNNICNGEIENENKLKNNINNYNCFNLDENYKKNDLNIEPDLNDNYNYNCNHDFFATFGNNINNYNNNFYSFNNRDEMDERLEKYKKCPKLELDYKQNLREQLGIIFNLENIINQKLFFVQKQIGSC